MADQKAILYAYVCVCTWHMMTSAMRPLTTCRLFCGVSVTKRANNVQQNEIFRNTIMQKSMNSVEIGFCTAAHGSSLSLNGSKL